MGAYDRLLPWLAGKRAKSIDVETEALFLAVLLKHGNLLMEASAALSHSGDLTSVPLSPAMEDVGKKLKQFLKYLEDQRFYDRQGYLEKALMVGDATSALPEVTSTDGVSSTVTSTTSGPGVEESKSTDVPRSGPTVTRGNRTKGKKGWESTVEAPTSFTQVLAAAKLRCLLMLSMAPVKHTTHKAATASTPTSQLVQKWNDLLSPPTLAPLLMRWSSVGSSADEDAKSLLTGAVSSGQASIEAVSALFRNCLLYATRGANASPRLLLAILRRRIGRAAQRAFGLQALLSLLKATSFSSARREALLHLRPALRGKTGWMASGHGLSGGAHVGHHGGSDSVPVGRACPDPANIRHHYLKALEAVPVACSNSVQAAFIELYVHLGELLVQCAQFGDVGFGHVLAWNWSIDFEAADHEFVLRLGILPSLFKLFSLSQQAANAQSALVAASSQHSGPSRDGTAPVPQGWKLWPLPYVTRALSDGSLTKWELVMHMQSRGSVPAVGEESGQAWWRRMNLHRSVRTLASLHTVASLLDLFTEFTARVHTDTPLSPVTTQAATKIQAAFRSYFVRNVLTRQDSAELSPLPSPCVLTCC